MINARLSAPMVAAIDAWAKAAGLSRSDALRLLIENGLKQKPPTLMEQRLAASPKRLR
jgi:hypothetical protein